MNEPSYHWVTIARFWSGHQALFFKNVLEGHDIPAFVRNEHLGQLIPSLTLSGAQGGIQLQVPSDCVEAALEILEGLDENEEFLEEDNGDCADSETEMDDGFNA